MASVAVVLGAGGVVGGAFHAGVLTALAENGFDARRADVIVGTSAGSGVGAMLRAGFPPLDLAARSLERPLSSEAMAIVGQFTSPPTIDVDARPRAGAPASPKMLLRAGVHPGKALAGLLPPGRLPTAPIGERIAAAYGSRTWPDDALWICGVDLDSGRRVVFGREEHDVPVNVAVEASSAIPGFFAPVEHAGKRYVDGAVHSPTNADLVARLGYDLVVVISPMSAHRSLRPAAMLSGRPLFAARLSHEVRHLKSGGSDVLVFEPTDDELSVMGRNSMDVSRRGPVTEAALDTARRRLDRPSVAAQLDVLRAAGG